MSDHRIAKPAIFISHATSDGEFAHAVKQEVEKVFAGGVKVFCTSSPGSIAAGEDWLAEIERKLAAAKAVVVIVTPVSIERPWLWFELGAVWSRSRAGDCRIYPLCAPEVSLRALPDPLDRLQALSLGRGADLRGLFTSLVTQFGFGNLSSFRATNITKRIPKYKNVKISPEDANERPLYTGPFMSYSDEELAEIIDAKLFYPDCLKRYRGHRENKIENGMLLHYKEVDRQLNLPPGTASRLLKAVASRYSLEPTLDTGNIVRFQASSDRR